MMMLKTIWSLVEEPTLFGWIDTQTSLEKSSCINSFSLSSVQVCSAHWRHREREEVWAFVDAAELPGHPNGCGSHHLHRLLLRDSAKRLKELHLHMKLKLFLKKHKITKDITVSQVDTSQDIPWKKMESTFFANNLNSAVDDKYG